MTLTNTLIQLRNLLANYFSVDQLHELAFDLDVDVENLPHRETKSELARELVLEMAHGSGPSECIDELRRRRPAAPWPDPLPNNLPYGRNPQLHRAQRHPGEARGGLRRDDGLHHRPLPPTSAAAAKHAVGRCAPTGRLPRHHHHHLGAGFSTGA